jgi:enoyl-CoA hydratase/carnithine racemase
LSLTRVDSPHRAVELESSEGFVVARVNHPPANALSPVVLAGLDAAADAVERHRAAALLITSDLDGFFAAGADIKHMRSLDGPGFAGYGAQMRTVFERIAGLQTITIAAIDGVALGGGLELALACKLRIGSTGARLGVPEIKLGLIPGAGGTQRLPRLIGRGRALDMLLTGRQVTGPEAHAIGLIDRLVPDGEAEDHALAMARQLAGVSVPALSATERCVEAALRVEHSVGLQIEADEEQALFEDGEALEGIAAFVSRRAPVFVSAQARRKS